MRSCNTRGLANSQLTELLPSDDLDDSRAVGVQHAMKPSDMRETVLATQAGLEAAEGGGQLDEVVVQVADPA